ncbi:MAG: cytochrome c3 family protein [Nitrospirae bacterium]|nr:cytochrome c3 family protein [Nitrospirota bacterium]
MKNTMNELANILGGLALLMAMSALGCTTEEKTIVQGLPGAAAAKSDGLTVTLSTSQPKNGSFFAAGERIVVTLNVMDDKENPLTLDDLSTAGLYMYGPKNVQTIKTASALLNASTDRDAAGSLHHYVDLKKAAAPDLTVKGNVLTYTLQPITSEEAGTYTVGFRSVATAKALSQSFELADVQIGTADVQKEIVGNCADCHKGALSGKFYLHHADPTGRNPAGGWAIDSDPVRTCKNCHNQEGYAAYCASRTESPCSAANKVPDNIVRRVHGVHMGEELENPLNIDPKNGDFKDYTEVVFPADVRNCTKCHLDDSWKTKPSRLACGACHDHVDFSTGEKHGGHEGGQSGGVQTDDKNCATCHPPDTGGVKSVAEAHKVPPPAFNTKVELALTPPANGSYYVDEAPVLTVTVKDAATGAVIDPATITATSFSRANIFVSGPRSGTEPVLTTTAGGAAHVRANVTNGSNGPWDLSGSPTFMIDIDNKGPFTITASASKFADASKATQAEVVSWLNDKSTGIGTYATASKVSSSGASKVLIKSNTIGTGSEVEILAGTVTTNMKWTVGVNVNKDTHTYANNDFRVMSDPLDEDPKVKRSSTAITYQLDNTKGLRAGTYSVWVEAGAKPLMGWSLLNFQVGTATEDKKIATNCKTCHEDTRMHATYFGVEFNPDICKSCHDYKRQMAARQATDPADGWGVNAAAGRSNMGFGSAPLARRVHGVHRGHYLDKPKEVHATEDYSGVIFPQDIRNCTKCHAETNSWNENPSRLACLACHDGDAAIAHGTAMTVDPTPADAWSGDEAESCRTCHGVGKEFAVSTVHNVWDPYKPPYKREKE